jgi:predicted nucleotidyltransferase
LLFKNDNNVLTNKQEILHFLKDNKSELFSDYQLTKLGLFGSFARGEETDESDIDLIVEFEPNTENLTEKKHRIKALAEKQFNREVDICREKYIKPYFKSYILQSAVYV